MIEGNCYFTGMRPIREILNEAPKGMRALFSIIRSRDEHLLDSVVYVSGKGNVIDVITEKIIKDVEAGDLKFLRYSAG